MPMLCGELKSGRGPVGMALRSLIAGGGGGEAGVAPAVELAEAEAEAVGCGESDILAAKGHKK